ncbi:tape measure protein [Lysinibacillus sp. NPDC097162]|uniref:tape measure protein n=1 Tax=Lysinibacillus sp. NPDC097162 TaxID=3364140 RepID=UPI0038145E5E
MANNNEVQITFRASNQEFNKSMAEMNKETAALRQQMKLQQEQMKHNATDSEKLEAKINSLQQIYEVARRKTEATTRQLEEAKALWGENSEEAKKLETQLRRNQIAEQQAANAIAETQQALQRAQQSQADQNESLRQLENLFAVTGKTVNDFSGILGRDLTRAIQNGTASANQLDRAFDQISRSSLNAGRDLTEVRTAIRSIDNGSSVEQVRFDLERLSQSASEAEQEVNELGDSLKSMAGAAVATVGIGTVISEALSSASLDTSIKLSFNVPEESKATVRAAVKDVEAYGVEGEAALEGVRRQWSLNAEATDNVNREVVKSAATISRAYAGIDFTELIQESNEIADALGINNLEAVNLVNNLLAIGFPPEQLDIISEYGIQLKRAGFEAKQIQTILANAALSKSWNIDNLLDGLKEGRIKAVEMGRGMTESMKDAIRDVAGGTKKVTDEQLAMMEDGFAKQEEAMSKSLDRQEKALSKSHSKQQDALSKKLDSEYNAASKNYDQQLKSLEKSLSDKYDAVSNNYDEQQKLLEKSLAAEVKEFERASNEKIKVIDNEFKERLKLIDEEKYNQLKALDAQIDSLNARTAAEDKVIKERENSEKKAELNKAVRVAKNGEERQKAIKNLRDFEEKLRLESIREDRKKQIDNLKEQKDSVKDASDAKKDALKTEIDERKEHLKEQTNAEKEAMSERHNAQKEALQQQKKEELKALSESNKAQIDAMREVNQAKLSYLKEEQNNRKSALSERLSNEMDAVKEAHQAELASFKAMNDEKVAIAKDPPDSAAVQALFSKLEGFGKAIAKGGEEGAQAFTDMSAWLDSIGDATLRETIGVELFGTMYEDQGEKITNVLQGVYASQEEVADGQKNIQDNIDKLDSDPMTEINQAFTDIKEALNPLLSVIADVLGAFAGFAKEHPVLVSTFVAIVSAVGILVGAFAALSPAIMTIMSMLGTGGGGLGFGAILGKIIPLIVNIATKILPALRIAFGALTGPIGIVVTALTIAVPLIIKNWDSIVEFFGNLWDFVIGIFKNAGTAIWEFVKKNWEWILAAITGPVGLAVKIIKDNWDKIKKFTDFSDLWKKTKEIWDKVATAIMSPIDKAKEAVRKAIEAIKSFFKFDFEWPKLKVPKFKIKGSLNPLDWFGEGLPKIDIQWHAKGGVFNKPTLFNTGNALHGVGEAGPEAILPLNERVLGAIGRAIFDAAGGGRQEAQVIHHNYERMLEGAQFIIREEADIKKVTRQIYEQQQRDRKGK